jgi:hypothetical protein
MPQFARPDADTTLGNFQDQAAGTTNIFQAIDETSASDSDYIRSPQSPSSEVYVCRLSDVTDPVSSSNHVMRMRVSTDVASGGETLDFTLQLRMTYVSEGSQGTLIASVAQNGVSGTSWVDVSYTLSGAEADAITDYTALFYRIIVNKP